MIDLKALAAPFPPERISWRVGSTTKDKSKGMALAYIDARDVQDRLDQVCQIDGWQCRYVIAGTKTVCEIGIRVEPSVTCGVVPMLEWIWKSDGAGDTDFEADKGALSDAFKRAAVRWGIGRYLYDTAAPWVAIEAMGQSWKIAESEMPKLRGLLAKGTAFPSPPPSKVAFTFVDLDGVAVPYAKASDFLKRLETAMKTNEPVAYWAVNGSLALDIANKMPDKAGEIVRRLQTLAQGKAA